MRLVCDENVRYSIANVLRQEGHDVERVRDALTTGDADAAIVEYCRESGRVVLTNDDDFLTVDDHAGVLFLDEQRAPPREVAVAVQRVERYVGSSPFDGQVFHVPDGWA